MCLPSVQGIGSQAHHLNLGKSARGDSLVASFSEKGRKGGDVRICKALCFGLSVSHRGVALTTLMAVVAIVTLLAVLGVVTLVTTHAASHGSSHGASHLVSEARLHSAALHVLTSKLTRTSVHHWGHSHSSAHAATHALHHWAHDSARISRGAMCHINGSSLAFSLVSLSHGLDRLHHLLQTLLFSLLEFLHAALLSGPSHIFLEPVDVLLDGLVLF